MKNSCLHYLFHSSLTPDPPPPNRCHIYFKSQRINSNKQTYSNPNFLLHVKCSQTILTYIFMYPHALMWENLPSITPDWLYLISLSKMLSENPHNCHPPLLQLYLFLCPSSPRGRTPHPCLLYLRVVVKLLWIIPTQNNTTANNDSSIN